MAVDYEFDVDDAEELVALGDVLIFGEEPLIEALDPLWRHVGCVMGQNAVSRSLQC